MGKTPIPPAIPGRPLLRRRTSDAANGKTGDTASYSPDAAPAALLPCINRNGELLELELTESLVMQNIERTTRILAALKAMGVRIAIDDFGVGYSSLADLQRFPIDTLKPDRSFIRDLASNNEDRTITEAIITMGRMLSMTVVAEGVETRERQAFLLNHACDEMQGFCFSKPIGAGEFAEFLVQHEATMHA